MPGPEARRENQAAPSVARMTPAEAFERARTVALEPLRRDRERVDDSGLAAILADSKGLAKPELLYQAVWRAAKQLPPELQLVMIRDHIDCADAAELFDYLREKSSEAGRKQPIDGAEVGSY